MNALRIEQAWEVGLAGLPDAQEARNVIISDEKVRAFVGNAYGLDNGFGLISDMLAITGARPSQVVRLRVDDLQDHPVRPKLVMPKIGKGGSRNRSAKKARALFGAGHRATGSWLKAAAKGRDAARRCSCIAMEALGVTIRGNSIIV